MYQSFINLPSIVPRYVETCWLRCSTIWWSTCGAGKGMESVSIYKIIYEHNQSKMKMNLVAMVDCKIIQEHVAGLPDVFHRRSLMR
jgi:hypothetical protein